MATPKISKQLERARDAVSVLTPEQPAPVIPEQSSPAPTLTPEQQMLMAILQQNAAVMETLRPKPDDAITAEYLADPRNKVQKLLKPCFQNGRPVNPSGLSDTTVEKLASIKPGRYLDGMFTVLEANDADKTTHIIYKSKTGAERMAVEHKLQGRGFAHLVDLLYAEQTAKDAK